MKTALRFCSFAILVLFSFGCSQSEKKLTTDELFKKVKDSIVYIGVRDEQGQFVSSGTGVIVSPEGHILTNWHVVEENSGGVVELQNGANYFYQNVQELDPYYDLAVIKIDAQTPFQPATLANSDTLSIGQKVVAIGNPKGMKHTVSEGIISSFRNGVTNKQVQFTAPISPGSSGGALFDEYGKVIGITTTTLLEAQNINFAVPINFAKSLIYRRTISLQAHQNKLTRDNFKELEAYIPFEANLLSTLLDESLDQVKDLTTVSLELETLQKSNYNDYQRALSYVDDQTAKNFSYLMREETFVKAMNAVKDVNKSLVDKFKTSISDNIDVKRILDLKSYFTNPYYYQVIRCNIVIPERTVSALIVEDYGRNKSQCLKDNATYLEHVAKPKDFLQCATLDGSTAESSCVKKDKIYPTMAPYMNNQNHLSAYLSGLSFPHRQPIRVIFSSYDSYVKTLCQFLRKKSFVEEPSQCIPPSATAGR